VIHRQAEIHAFLYISCIMIAAISLLLTTNNNNILWNSMFVVEEK
jgi:hypothetical protein